MIVVHTFGRFSDKLSSVSPFVLKLETWLRLAGLPSKSVGDYSPFTAPRGKAPWVTLEDGSTLSDSALIIEALSARPEVTLDDHLTDADRARHLLIQRTVEDHLYWCVVYERWQRPEGFAIVKQRYFPKASPLMLPVITTMARRTAVGQLRAQGTGRHDWPDVERAAVADIRALSAALGDAPFFGGASPATIDAVVYGALANAAWGPFEGAMQRAVLEDPALAAWLDRVWGRAWAKA